MSEMREMEERARSWEDGCRGSKMSLEGVTDIDTLEEVAEEALEGATVPTETGVCVMVGGVERGAMRGQGEGA